MTDLQNLFIIRHPLFRRRRLISPQGDYNLLSRLGGVIFGFPRVGEIQLLSCFGDMAQQTAEELRPHLGLGPDSIELHLCLGETGNGGPLNPQPVVQLLERKMAGTIVIVTNKKGSLLLPRVLESYILKTSFDPRHTRIGHGRAWHVDCRRRTSFLLVNP